jgi:hypothetical protein
MKILWEVWIQFNNNFIKHEQETTVKFTVCLDVKPCSLANRFLHFGATCCHYCQDRRGPSILPMEHPKSQKSAQCSVTNTFQFSYNIMSRSNVGTTKYVSCVSCVSCSYLGTSPVGLCMNLLQTQIFCCEADGQQRHQVAMQYVTLSMNLMDRRTSYCSHTVQLIISRCIAAVQY